MRKCFDFIWFKYQFGFGEGYGSQQCLLLMIEKKWKEVSLDSNGTCVSDWFIESLWLRTTRPISC